MSDDTSDRWGQLRSELDEPGAEAWWAIVELIASWPQPERDEALIPYLEDRLRAWPERLIRPAPPEWATPALAGDPDALRLVGLARAPGCWVVRADSSVAGYELSATRPATTLREAGGVVESHFQEVAVRRSIGEALFRSTFSLWACCWGCVLPPRVNLRSWIEVEVAGERRPLSDSYAAQRVVEAWLRTHGVDLDARMEPHRGRVNLRLTGLPELGPPVGTPDTSPWGFDTTSSFGSPFPQLEVWGELESVSII